MTRPPSARPRRVVAAFIGTAREKLAVRGRWELSAAFVAALLCAVAAASFLSFLTWQTAPALPTDGEAQRMIEPALPANSEGPHRLEAVFAADAERGWKDLLLGTDGYRTGSVSWLSTWPDRSAAVSAVNNARDPLRRAGWDVGPVLDETCCPTFVAYRDGWRIEVGSQGVVDADRVGVQASVTRTAPALASPAALAGAALGAIAGWWMIAGIAHHIRRRPAAESQPVVVLFITGSVALLPAAAVSALALGQALSAPAEPIPVWLGFGFVFLRLGAWIGAALLTIAVLTLWRRPGLDDARQVTQSRPV
ncbi:hypothetical protein ACGFJ4_04725 [Micromonospora chalcea]|uniref:hypothetical protein n=1 Tax=Micromonospora TaxID=1873 RepID=UPI000B1596AF|nr:MULTISPECIES: hypothetical protein [Micromonospora]MBQ1061167.1 hypothetical protein [Micromonospora sp. C41]WDP99204.1 hypothetical protein PVK74_25645 [Micromonospora chalcea]